MCEGYDAEYRSIQRSEDRAAKQGFAAAVNGKPKDNTFHPVYEGYQHKAYEHGYGCAAENIIPWGICSEIERAHGQKERIATSEAFCRGKMTPLLTKAIKYV